MDATSESLGQDTASVAQNSKFFTDVNERYAKLLTSMETYRQVSRVVGREIAGTGRLLDVGNGGVFDYDTGLAEEIVGVDLCLDATPPNLPEHIALRYGDALALDEPNGAYDTVLESSVFHHLIGTDVDSTLSNIRQAVGEAHRVLKPGGRYVVTESCVNEHVFAIERRLFAPLRLLARTPLLRHPATLQFPIETIAGVIRDRFGNVAVEPIPLGRLILQFGFRWPTALTPARIHLFTATRT
jgi:SAM-dependent methyltransferase